MDRKQVIKALECCHTPSAEDCEKCPYRNKGTVTDLFYTGCCNELCKDALALIRELTEENNDLRETNKIRGETIESLQMFVSKITEENERLRATRYMVDEDGRLEMIPTVKSVRAATVRKMQERLKEGLEHYPQRCGDCFKEKVDQIAKELLEGNDEV